MRPSAPNPSGPLSLRHTKKDRTQKHYSSQRKDSTYVCQSRERCLSRKHVQGRRGERTSKDLTKQRQHWRVWHHDVFLRQLGEPLFASGSSSSFFSYVISPRVPLLSSTPLPSSSSVLGLTAFALSSHLVPSPCSS
jgi:hypothetical protein